MSAKQDRTGARTATDLERKYNFGSKFSEILGLIDDTRKDVDSVESGLKDEIKKTETSIRRDTEKVAINIRTEIANGIRLETGYTFDSNGLRIAKSGEPVENLLDNTGMYVNRSGGENVLTANEDGVIARDLHAKTYLKIGSDDGRRRFEDYGNDRTGCFWIGG